MKGYASINEEALNKGMAERLRKERKAMGYTQVDMSAALDISTVTYGRYERGESPIPTRILYQLHNDLNINLNELVSGDSSASDQKLDRFIKEIKLLIAGINNI